MLKVGLKLLLPTTYKSRATEERMCGTCPSTFVVRRLAATSAATDAGSGRRRLHVVARPCRHRLDTLEVYEEVDRADDQRQRRHNDERQYGGRLKDRVPAGGRRGRWRVGLAAGPRSMELGGRERLELQDGRKMFV